MGVDTKLLVRTSIDAEDIMTALKALGREEIEYKATHSPRYATIMFKATTPGWDRRIIHFFYGLDDEFGVPMNSISLRHNEESVALLKELATMIGGLFQEVDYDNNWESFQVPGQGDMRWLIEQYYLNNKSVPRDCDEQIEQFVKYTKER